MEKLVTSYFGWHFSLNGINYAKDKFILVSGDWDNEYGIIFTSKDGKTWENKKESNYLYRVSYVNNKFIVVGRSGTLLSSSDGDTWDNLSTDVDYNLWNIDYGNNKYLIVTDNGRVLTSNDAISWEASASLAKVRFFGSVYANKVFVIVGDNGTVLTSTDSITWKERFSGTTSLLNSIDYGDDTFIAVGRNGTIIKSVDNASTWKVVDSGSTESLLDITFKSTPKVTSISPSDNGSSISVTDNISITFSETMDKSSITINTSDTSCSGTVQVSSDNFSTCEQMGSSYSGSNSNKTFTFDPSDNLSYLTTYKIRVTSGVKDVFGNQMESIYDLSLGFITKSSFGGIKQFGSSFEDRGYKIVSDYNDNFYITGYTKGNLNGNINLGDSDVFIIKKNLHGITQWTTQIGSPNLDEGKDLHVDSEGNIYVTGITEGDFDNKTNLGDKDLALFKLNNSGEILWSKIFGTSSQDGGLELRLITLLIFF